MSDHHVCHLPERGRSEPGWWRCPVCGQPWGSPTGWIEAPRRVGDPGPTYVPAPCRHPADVVVPVESVAGEVVAQLCTSCDMALHADWAPPRQLAPPPGPSSVGAPPTIAELNAFVDADRALHDRHRHRASTDTTTETE